ncbi:hypothetical protein MRB53_040875 [Persea americana]|nr:hypothetical protein MRB53_040875 [Persea americana]
MFMHNGGIGGWTFVKRRLCSMLAERWFLGVQGSTDSEWAFALFLHNLESMGYDPSVPPSDKGFGHTVLRKALLATIAGINSLTATVDKRANGGPAISLLNFAVTDGHSVVCSRYVSSLTDEAASLFFSSGTSWTKVPSAPPQDGTGASTSQQTNGKSSFQMACREKRADIVLVPRSL